ncbi:MAG: ComEA family DNA-binding protein [Actinomycetales bacterium]|nr:MAG: ComEA family DNA-binding protein [Actinomycetales bacterium]
MRRESVEVSAAARQRLELLGRDLGRMPVDDAPEVTLVPAPGRHARESTPPGNRALSRVDDLRERLGWTSAHLAVVAVLAAAGLAVVAWSVLHSAPREVAAPTATGGPTAVGPPLLVAATSEAVARTEVVIDVAGKVRRPGVATLPAGSRVIDALKHAGGARPGVDLSTLNLARPLVDGEQILVGVAAASGPAAGAVSAPVAGALVNLNSATVEQLEGLPGVGPVTASKIVDWRTEHGAFSAVDELLDVDGIGTKTLAELAPHVTL